MTLHDRRGLAVSTSNRGLARALRAGAGPDGLVFRRPARHDQRGARGRSHLRRRTLPEGGARPDVVGARRAADPRARASRPSRRSAGGPTNASACTQPRAAPGSAATSLARSGSTATSSSTTRATCWPCRSRTSATSSSASRRCCATGWRRCCRTGTKTCPGYGYVLGMYAFGLEETANYAGAEATGRRALELNPRDPWAVHAVAHVMEMQGRLRDGIDWLTTRQADWSVDNGLAFHNWWHLGAVPPRSRRRRACRRALRHLHPAGPVFGRAGDGGRLGNAVAPDAARRGRRCPLAAARRFVAAARGGRLLRVQRRACRHGAGGRRPLG